MPPPADADDWHLVTDAKKRKQIQDRLAQRARRKRLREAQKATAPSHGDCTAKCRSLTSETVHCCQLISATALDLDTTAPQSSIASTVFAFTPLSLEDEMDLFNATPTIIRELGLTHSIAAALYFNGEVLGLSCCTVVPSRSPPAGDHVPGSLRPTSTQMITIHQMGVDRFPFPRMRDNMITMNGLFDDDEFARDLLTTPSFQIDAGAPSWEPRAWKVSRQFADKWGFLF